MAQAPQITQSAAAPTDRPHGAVSFIAGQTYDALSIDHIDGGEALSALAEFEARMPPRNVSLDLQQRAYGTLGRPAPDRRPHFWGHRERLRQRFLKGGADGLPDYELLELILFNAISRIDVKPLAKELLAAFGDLNAVITAPAPRLMKVRGITEKVIVQFRLAEALAGRLARSKVLDRSVITSWSQLMTYCKMGCQIQPDELIRHLLSGLAAGSSVAQAEPEHERRLALHRAGHAIALAND